MTTMIITITIDEEFWVSLIWEAWETQEAYETQETKETHCHEAQQIAGQHLHLHPDHDVESSGHPPTLTPTHLVGLGDPGGL